MSNQQWFPQTPQAYFTPNSTGQNHPQNYFQPPGYSSPPQSYGSNYPQYNNQYQTDNQPQYYQPTSHSDYPQNSALHYSESGSQKNSSQWQLEESGGGWDEADLGELDEPILPTEQDESTFQAEEHNPQFHQPPALHKSVSPVSNQQSRKESPNKNINFGSFSNADADPSIAESFLNQSDTFSSLSISPRHEIDRLIEKESPPLTDKQFQDDKVAENYKFVSGFSAPSLPPPAPISQFNNVLSSIPNKESIVDKFEGLKLNSDNSKPSQKNLNLKQESAAVNTSTSWSSLDFNTSSNYYNMPPPPAPLNISAQLPLDLGKETSTHSYTTADIGANKSNQSSVKQEPVVVPSLPVHLPQDHSQSSLSQAPHIKSEADLLDSPRSNKSVPVPKTETRGKGSIRRDPRLSNNAVLKTPPSHEVKQVIGEMYSRPSSAHRAPGPGVFGEQPMTGQHHYAAPNYQTNQNQLPQNSLPSYSKNPDPRSSMHQQPGGQMHHSSSYHSFPVQSGYDQPQRPMSRNSVASDAGVSSEQRQREDYMQQWNQYFQSLMQHPFYSQFYGGGQQVPGMPTSSDANSQSMTDPYAAAYYQYYYSMAAGQQWNTYADPYSQMQPAADRGRRTPPLFNIPHRKVCLGTPGLMMQNVPSRPDEGEPARVELHWLSPCDEDDRLEFCNFPGPLMRETTFKADVRAFLKDKLIEIQDRMPTDWESAALLIAYLDFLVKNNGIAHGDDLADLLLEGHDTRTSELRDRGISIRSMSSMEMLASLPPSEPASGRQSPTGSSSLRYKRGPGSVTSEGAAATLLRTQQVLERERSIDNVNDRNLDRFRKLLMYGRKMEALEYACRHDIWGHAFALAFQLNVMHKILTRFLNKAIRTNDPIQSFHQMMSSQVPAAVTAPLSNNSSNYGQVIDWGDWRPHLAMILSVQSENSNLACESIERLGDTLAGQHLLYASQLCYLLAGVKMCDAQGQGGKILLLGCDHQHYVRSRSKKFDIEEVAVNEAIQFTEIYEYAMSLADRNYYLPHLQPYKFIYATRLLDAGLIEQCFRYCYSIARVINRYPHQFGLALINGVLTLSERLQFHPDCEVSFSSNEWIAQLRDAYHTQQVKRASVDEEIPPKQEPFISMDNSVDYTNQSESSYLNATQITAPSHQQEIIQQVPDSHHNPPKLFDNSAPTMQQPQFTRRPSGDTAQGKLSQQGQYHEQDFTSLPASGGAPPGGHNQYASQDHSQRMSHFNPPQPYPHHSAATSMQPVAFNQPNNGADNIQSVKTEPQFHPVQSHHNPSSQQMQQNSYQQQPPHNSDPHGNNASYSDNSNLYRNGNNHHPSPPDIHQSSVPPSPSKVANLPNQPGGPFFNAAMSGPNPPAQFFNPANAPMHQPVGGQQEESHGVSNFDYFSQINSRERTLSNSSNTSNQQNRHPYGGPSRSRNPSHSSIGPPQPPPSNSRSRENSFGQHQRPPSGDAYPQENYPGGSINPQRKESTGDSNSDAKMPSLSQQQQDQQQAGWLGGLFSKFRKQGGPKQAHLPDDSKPTIVWDPKKNDWIDTTKSEEDNQPLPPPPKMPMGGPQLNAPGPGPSFGGGPPLSARQPRSRYVNVLQGKTTSVSTPNNLLPPMPGMAPGPPSAGPPHMQQGFPVQQQPQFFVPPPGPQ